MTSADDRTLVPMGLVSAIGERVDEAHEPRAFDRTTDSRIPRGRERGLWASFECPWASGVRSRNALMRPMGLAFSIRRRTHAFPEVVSEAHGPLSSAHGPS